MRKIFLLNLLFCLCVGCGTGHYEKLLDNRKTTAKPEAPSTVRELPGTKVSVRMLNSLGSPLANVEDSRSKPGIVTIPGLKQTYEVFVKDSGGGEQPYYCYIGAVETRVTPMQTVANELRAQLSNQPMLNALGEWSDFQSEAPDGRQVSWRKLRFTGAQQFYYKKDGQGKAQLMSGMLEIYLHEEAGFVVIVAWRMSTNVEPAIGLEELVRLTAGGVSVGP